MEGGTLWECGGWDVGGVWGWDIRGNVEGGTLWECGGWDIGDVEGVWGGGTLGGMWRVGRCGSVEVKAGSQHDSSFILYHLVCFRKVSSCSSIV